MKIIKRIIIWLLVIVALLVLVAYLLPKTYYVERSTLIKGDNDMIFSMTCDFNNWDFWSPWSYDDDSTCVIENIGKCEVGAVQKWDGVEMGKGMMKITELIPGEKIGWEMTFEGYSHVMYIDMTFTPEGDDWVISWSAKGDLGYNPLFRYYGLMVDSDLGPDYEQGLENLKVLCEQLPDYPGIEVTTVQSAPALSVKDSVLATNLGDFMGAYLPMIYMYALRMEAEPVGHPYAIYYNWDPDGKILMETGIPLAEAIEGEDLIMSVNSPGGKVVKAAHFGPYGNSYKTHEAINQYIMVMKMDYAGPPWEVYVTDPMQEPDSSKWETIIYYPVK